MIKSKRSEIPELDLPKHIVNGNTLKQSHSDNSQFENSNFNVKPEYNGLRIPLTRERLIDVLNQTDGNKAKTARILGVSRATLYRFIKKYPDLKEKYE